MSISFILIKINSHLREEGVDFKKFKRELFLESNNSSN